MNLGQQTQPPIRTGLGVLRLWERIYGLAWFVIIIASGAAFGYAASKKDLKDYLPVGMPIAIAVATVISQRWIGVKSKIASNEDTLDKVILELLSDAVARIARSLETQQRDSLEWLTSARSIATALKLVKDVEEPTKKSVLEERIFLLRLKTRQLFNPHEGPNAFDGMPISFYADSERQFYIQGGVVGSGIKAPILEAALVEIYRFSQWPKDRKDVLPTPHSFSGSEIEEMVIAGPRVLGRLLKARREYMRLISDASGNREILGLDQQVTPTKMDISSAFDEKRRILDSSSASYEEALEKLTSARDGLITIAYE